VDCAKRNRSPSTVGTRPLPLILIPEKPISISDVVMRDMGTPKNAHSSKLVIEIARIQGRQQQQTFQTK
jgi:hypothetical protein